MGNANYAFRLDPFQWEGKTELQKEDVLQPSSEGGSAPGEAEAFLGDAVKDSRRLAGELVREAAGCGITRRTLQRAARQLGVVPERAGFGGKVYWSLPPIDATITTHLQKMARMERTQ